MKIALVSAYFYPNSSGGTEKYVLNLAKKLIEDGNHVQIITSYNLEKKKYFYEEIEVITLADETFNKAEIISGTQANPNIKWFEAILKAERYSLVHFHTLTPAFNLFHIEKAKQLGAKIYFTAHVPNITCLHGDLMLYGKTACDGEIRQNRCTACYLSKKGLPQIFSPTFSYGISLLNYPKSISRAVEQKKSNLEKLNEFCDFIFIFTQWQNDTFIKNGIEAKKIVLTNQFLNKEIIIKTPSNKKIKNIGFVGRICKEKGLHLLIDAFNKSKRDDLFLHIAGVKNEDSYYNILSEKTNKQNNIFWSLNLSTEEVNEFYKRIDLLIIPSITYETGPFVLFEALERNIPILANNLGDMKVWAEKGFDIETYENNNELYRKILNL